MTEAAVSFAGNLTDDPEVRYTDGDGILATFDGPVEGSAARPLYERNSTGSACSSGRGCIPARSSYASVTSAASPSTSPPG
jgi:hypothetical protein